MASRKEAGRRVAHCVVKGRTFTEPESKTGKSHLQGEKVACGKR